MSALGMRPLTFLLGLVLLLWTGSAYCQQLKLGLPLGHRAALRSAEFSPDGKLAVTSALDFTVKVWETSTGKLIHNFEGHSGHVTSVIISPDGNYIASTSFDKNVRIWSIDSGELMFALEGHTAPVMSAEFSADSKLLLSRSQDQTVKLWDVEKGVLQHNLNEHAAPIWSAHFSPDGLSVLTASYDKTAKLWSSKTGDLLQDFIGHARSVHDALFSGDGRWILTYSQDRTAKIWDVENGDLMQSFGGHSNDLHSASFSPDGKYVVTAAKDSLALVWEVGTGSLTHTLVGHTAPIRSAVYSPNGQLLATTSEDLSVKIWEAANGRLKHSLEGHSGFIWSATFSPDGLFIVTASEDHTAKIWDVESGDMKHDLLGHIGSVKSAKFSKDGRTVITSSEDMTSKIWSSHGVLEKSLEGLSMQQGVVKFSPSGDYLYFAAKDNSVKIIDTMSGKLHKTLDGHSDRIWSTSFSLEENFVVTSSSDQGANIWDVKTGERLYSLDGHTGIVYAADFSTDAQYVITASSDNTARIWSVATGEMAVQLSGHEGIISQAAFSPDGSQVVTASSDGTARVWNVSDGSLVDTIIEHEESVFRAEFSPNGGVVASASWDIVGLWSSHDGSVKILDGHSDGLKSVRFSGDGSYIVTGSFDDTAIVWDVASGEAVHRLEGHAGDVNQAVFSHNSQYIITASNDFSAKIWDGTTGAEIHHLKGHSGPVSYAEFSPDDKWCITTSSDGSFIIWNALTGEKLVQYLLFKGNEFVVVDDQGLFDASPGAMREMYWTLGLEVIGFEQLKDRFYEPGLWGKLLTSKNEPLRRSRGLGSIRLYPEMEIIHPHENNGVMVIRLYDRGGGIGKVVIGINGKEVISDARGGHDPEHPNSSTIEYQIEGHPFLTSGKPNEIEVKAFNEEGYLSSRARKIHYVPTKAADAKNPSLYAIVVGTSNYSGDQLDLRYAAKDATDFAIALESISSEFFDNGSVNIRLLTTDRAEAELRPTKTNIQRVFQEYSAMAKPYDVLLIYLSGHGVNYGGSEGDFYYLTNEASSGNLIDPVVRANVGISSEELTDYIKTVPALKQVMILDACHSGRLADDLMAARSDRPSSEIRALERMKDRVGMYILAGSAADAVSYEASVYGQGLLTYSLLLGMKGAALREGKFVDVMRLFQFGADEVPRLAAYMGGIQKPEVRVPYGGESFDIGLSTEEIQDKIVLPSPKPMFVRSVFQNEDTFDDNLRLSEQIDNIIKEYGTARDDDQQLIYIDASRFDQAYSLKGRYSEMQNGFEVDVRLFKGDEGIQSFQITGASEDLARQVFNKLIEVIN